MGVRPHCGCYACMMVDKIISNDPSNLLNQVPVLGHSLQTAFDRTKERMFRLRYWGAGHLVIVDKYHYSSYRKTIIIIIFPTRSAAWPPLSMHQGIVPSIFLFYNIYKTVDRYGAV